MHLRRTIKANIINCGGGVVLKSAEADENAVLMQPTKGLTTTNIEDSPVSETLKLYPNPTTGKLVLENSGASSNTSVSVIDMSGKVVFSGQTSQSRFEMDISHAVSGVYFVRINTGKDVIMKKIIKQ